MNKADRSILIVEDNLLNMELVVDVLETAGFVTHRAMDAEEGLHLARTLHPQLILMDISLPGMDGLSATVALKKDEATRDIPVIALTAHVMPGDEERVRAAGCDGYLTKPVNVRTLLVQIEAFLVRAYGGPS
jgi:two-component system cell cycle response regulator DivK